MAILTLRARRRLPLFNKWRNHDGGATQTALYRTCIAISSKEAVAGL